MLELRKDSRPIAFQKRTSNSACSNQVGLVAIATRLSDVRERGVTNSVIVSRRRSREERCRTSVVARKPARNNARINIRMRAQVTARYIQLCRRITYLIIRNLHRTDKFGFATRVSSRKRSGQLRLKD